MKTKPFFLVSHCAIACYANGEYCLLPKDIIGLADFIQEQLGNEGLVAVWKFKFNT